VSPAISAVLCTYNRREAVLEAIASLVAQELPASEYEIVVVDNRSTDGTRAAVEARFSGVPNLRVIREERQGIAYARNTGARACESPIAAFLDDDALAPPDWLASFLDRFRTLDPVPAVIGGDMIPIFEADRPEWLTDDLLPALSVSLRWSKEARTLKLHPEEWLCELNSAYRVGPLLDVGGFPEHVGRVGENLLSNENYVNRVLQHAGHTIYYDPAIVVRHHVPASRMQRSWFRRRSFWAGVSGAAVRDYLAERGIDPHTIRAVHVPCAPEAWVRAFDDSVEDGLEDSLEVMFFLGYLLGTQDIFAGSEPL
jgi:glycosyltransferase involved in cell wall biosynthesis